MIGGAWNYAKGLWPGIKAAASSAWASPYGRRTIIGAGVGAGWGMVSSDTSVLGGAIMGAGIGRYGSHAARGYMGLRNRGVRMSLALGSSMRASYGRAAYDASRAWKFSKTEAVNAFTALGL